MRKSQLYGDLTLEKWKTWYLSTYPGTMQQNKLKSYFNRISKSDLLIKRFLSYPENLKRVATNSIEYNLDPINIGISADLRLRLTKTKPFYSDGYTYLKIDWITASDLDIFHACQSNMSEDERSVLTTAITRFGVTIPNHSDEWGNFTGTISCLLTAAFGSETVIEAIELWVGGSNNSLPISEFVKLVENWENVKGYPLEWALNVAQEITDV